MSGGNANGGIKDELKEIELKGVTEISILALFFIQSLGVASVEDIDKRITEIHGAVNEHILHQALEGLRARGLLSYVRGTNSGGASIKMYKTTKVKWSQPPEVAHVTNLLPALLATEEAQGIINILNGAEASGKGGTKKAKGKLGYTEYYELAVTFITKTPIIGSQPSSPYLDALVKKSPYPYPAMDKGQSILRFWRDEETSAVVISSDTISGWLRTGLRYAFGLSDTVAHYCAVSEAIIMPKSLGQMSLPVIDPTTRRGLGINTYEVLNKGTEFVINFRLPKKGLTDPTKFVAWLTAYVPRPIRGLSPARGKRFGRLEVVDYKILGDSSTIENALNAISGDLQDPRALRIHTELLAKAKQFHMSFKEVKGGGDVVVDDALDDSEDDAVAEAD